MAGETLRDLVVSLSLDSDNFSRNIKSVNALIRESESVFKLAAAGLKDFENTTAGAAAKLDLVRNKYALQEKAVQQFSRAMQAAESKLVTSKNTYDKHARALQEAGVKVKEASENARIAKEQFDAVAAATGKNSNAALEARSEWEKYEKALSDAKEEQKKLESDLVRVTKSMQNNADAVARASAALNENEAKLKALGVEMGRLESRTYKVGVWFSSMAAEAEIAGRTLEKAGRGLTRYVTTPLLALGVASAKASIDFETAFVGVRKTVDATETQYRRMAGAIKEMSHEVADSAENIAGVVATAGQLGIANDHIMDFTKTVQDLTVSTEDLKGTAAAEEMAKFANIAQMSQGEVRNLGSAITYLGNNYATTEGAIMSMALNIAAAGKQVGLTEAQILGLAAGLSSVGLEAEKGGSAMSKALKQMEVAAETGGQALTDFARISGMTEEQFRAVWQSDPAGAFMAFIEGLARMDDEGISAIATMQEIGMSELRLSDTMLRTVNAHDLFNNALNDSTRAWEENTALTEEANKFYATTESRLKNVANRAKNFGARLGDDLNPQIQSLIDMADGMLGSLEELDSAQVRTITRIAGWAAAIGPLSFGMGKLVTATGSGTNALGKFLKSIADISSRAKVANTSFLSVAKSTLGFKAGIAGLSVALIAGAAALVYYTSNAYKTKAAIESMQDTVNDWKNSPTDTLFGGEGMSFFGLDETAFTDMGNTTKTMKEWRDGLIKVWTDGQKETNAIVDEWTGAFTDMTDHTRQQLEDLKTQTGGENSFVAADIDADIDALDELDREITALLKKRQNGLFTDDDMEDLQNAIDRREAIVVKYSLQEATGQGYEEIARGINDEMARATLEGRSIDFSVYEEGTLAAAQGYSLITKELEDQYDIQRRILEAEGDQEKLAELDYKYLKDRSDAAKDYVDILSQTAPPSLESEDAEKAQADMIELASLLEEYNEASADEKPAVLTEIQDFLADVDKDALVEYLALVQQITDAGDTAGYSDGLMKRLFGENYTEAIGYLGTIMQFLDKTEGEEFKPLKELFTDVVPDEVATINAELNRNDLVQQVRDFANSPESIVRLKGVIDPTGMDAVALANFKRHNEVDVVATVTLGQIYDNPDEAVADQAAKFFDEVGVELNVSDITADDLTKDTLVLLSESEDGTIRRNVIITAGTEDRESGELLGMLTEDRPSPFSEMTGIEHYTDVLSQLEVVLAMAERVTGKKVWDFLLASSPKDVQWAIDKSFDPEKISLLAAYVADVYKRLTEGGEVSKEEAEALQMVIDLLDELNSEEFAGTDTGANIISEIQNEMTEAGWEGTAETISDDLNDALNGYIDLRGAGAAAGEEYAAGLLSKKDLVASVGAILATTAANAMVNPATPAALAANPAGAGVASASSFMGTVGGAMMESLGLGALKEAPNQARIIGNAARYISTAAGRAVMGGGAYGAAGSTYNQQQTVNLTGNSFYVRSDQDINQLAYEIAAIMKRRQGGYGG